jgi:uncharacterized protein (DUF362 family)
MTRRNFIKLAGIAAGGALLPGCRPGPTASPPDRQPAKPARVGIARADSYDPSLVRRRTEELFDSLGGIRDVVQSGDTVAVKVNLVGGVKSAWPDVIASAPERYVTHPAVARAVCELLRDAGARKVYVVEAVWEWDSFEQWGYVSMAEDVGATLVDLNQPAPYDDFGSVPVGAGWCVYESFQFNRVLEEADALVSVAKMKCHYQLGVTQSMKNLVGLAPQQPYQLDPQDANRSAFHGDPSETGTRLPRVVIDLNRARPVDLALIDGIKTVDGSEGPWNNDLTPKSPGLIIGGKDPVAADSVAAAAMGFDPAAEYPDPPFLRAENHLNIACSLGLGTNRLAEIELAGASLEEVMMKFEPAW